MNEFDSIRITEKGDTLSFEMTNELADSSHEAIFFLIRATSALIASVTKDDADLKEVAEAFGKTFSRHIAQDGRVDPGEDVQMGEILAYMKNVATAAEAMQLWIKKNLKGEACNGKK